MTQGTRRRICGWNNKLNFNLATLGQKLFKAKHLKIKKIRYKRPKLDRSPQRRGIILRLRLVTPRKPNSARRPVAKVTLTTKKKVLAHIPGYGHTLRRHSRTLVCGVGARDLPYVNYTCMRGIYDFTPLYSKLRRRSIYANPKTADLKTHIRRKFREFL